MIWGNSWCFFPLLVHRFHVVVSPGTKLESGPATLHFCNDILVLVKDSPPTIMGQWKLSDLRRYGAVPNGFVFEGGTRCGYCEFLCLSFVVWEYRKILTSMAVVLKCF